MNLKHEDQIRGARSKARRVPIRTASPIVRAVFEKMLEQNVLVRDMAKALRHHPNVITFWRTGKTQPGVMSVEAMAHQLGYRIALVPLNQGEKK